ncbi:MAG TPA: MBL fold metallo-hydrolase [Kofleriaceae bacterium]|jgi:L-ascorbate metabolism protein UlaG (beta-lactamase superfamily)|nr:MBL fold metallo-hydrolase [Kofleriaceae bacterium]
MGHGRTWLLAVTLAACSGGGGGSDAAIADGTPADGPAADGLVLTWVGVTTWLLQYQDTAVLLDAYTSRQPWSDTGGNQLGAELLADLRAASEVDDVAAVLVGHAHFDHGFDLGAAAAAGAAVYGSQTTCYLTQAQGVAPAGCTVVAGGDSFSVGALTVRAVRLAHSFPAGIGQFDELDAPPALPLDETSVPVGAQLAYHVEAADDPSLSLFFYDNFAAVDADDGSGEDYAAALAAAYPVGTRARVWLAGVLPGAAGELASEAQIEAYLDRVQPDALLAQHWDDLTADPRLGLDAPFAAPAGWAAATAARDLPLLAPAQYFDRFAIGAAGLVRLPDSPLRDHYGL